MRVTTVRLQFDEVQFLDCSHSPLEYAEVGDCTSGNPLVPHASSNVPILNTVIHFTVQHNNVPPWWLGSNSK